LTGGAFTFRHSPDFFRCFLSSAFDVGFSVTVCRSKIHDDSRGKNHRVTGMSSKVSGGTTGANGNGGIQEKVNDEKKRTVPRGSQLVLAQQAG